MQSQTETIAGLSAIDHWLTFVRAVPTVMLHCALRAQSPTRIGAELGSRVNGALWAGLADRAADASGPVTAYQAQRLCALHENRAEDGGLRERLTVLRLPAAGVDIPAGGILELDLVLFGPCADYWPTIVLALADIRLGDRPLRLEGLSVRMDGQWCEPASIAAAADALEPLGALSEGFPTPPAGPVAIQLLSPAQLHLDGELVTRVDTLEPLAVAVLSSLGSAAVRRPGPEAARAVRELAAATPVRTLTMREVRALKHGSQRRDISYTLNGIEGTLIVEQLTGPLREMLALARFSHIGKAAAFGLGSYDITPAPAEPRQE